MIMAAQELVENIRFLNQNFTFSSLCLTFSLEFTLMQFFLYLLKDVNVNLWGVFFCYVAFAGILHFYIN